MAKKKNDKRTNNDRQNLRQKTKDRATRTLLNTIDEVRCFGRVSSSYSTCDNPQRRRKLSIITNTIHNKFIQDCLKKIIVT
jgi:hypothetical protein